MYRKPNATLISVFFLCSSKNHLLFWQNFGPPILGKNLQIFELFFVEKLGQFCGEI